jgi:hypothetical protein
MKFFALILLFFSSISFAEDPKILTCPRQEEIETALGEQSNWCNRAGLLDELLALEINAYQNDNLTSLLHDNVHDLKWLVRKSTQDIREHTFCLELICRTIRVECSANKSYLSDDWCSRVNEFGKIEQLKMQQVIIENQQRKSRSNLREKMRAIEVRTSYLFIPLLQKFFGEYRRFTEKVPTFLANPL